MAINKVVYGGNVLLDLTSDSVTPETLAEGTTAHTATGARITGTMATDVVRYGVQSLTEAQKAQARKNIGVPNEEDIVQQVITALGTPVFGRVDENNNIILTGELASGTYTIKYEDGEGNRTEIGTLDHDGTDEPSYTNVLPLAINSDGTLYNGGQGWKADTRLNSSGTETAQSGIECTGFIAVTESDTVYFSGISWSKTGANTDKYYITIYDASFTKLASLNMSNFKSHTTAGITYDEDGNVVSVAVGVFTKYYTKTGTAYLRISAEEITKASVITKNELIA